MQTTVKQAILILKRMALSWRQRAQIHTANSTDLLFDEEADDFLIELLPFKNHPLFQQASLDMKKKILSCGWIIYNAKTVAIENEIIHPACTSVLNENIPGMQSSIIKSIASQTMIDEAYHVSLAISAINLTQETRKLLLKIPKFTITTNMLSMQLQYNCVWQKELIQFVNALVCEMLISDYLRLLSNHKNIQPINAWSVNVHRQDELAHNNIFKNLAKCLIVQLSKKQREFFDKILPLAVASFADKEFAVWQQVLQQINFNFAAKMLFECQESESALKEDKPKNISIESLL